jgi:hypothetical protein
MQAEHPRWLNWAMTLESPLRVFRLERIERDYPRTAAKEVKKAAEGSNGEKSTKTPGEKANR